MSLVIAFSTLQEAQALLDQHSYKECSTNLYQLDFGYVLISGMGCMATLESLYKHEDKISELWNFGIAGALDSKVLTKALFEVCSVGKLGPTLDETSSHGMHVFHQINPPIKLCNKGMHLITSDYPLYHHKRKKELKASWDLVDMEGYAFASFAKSKGIPLKIWKGVSDSATEGGELSIQKLLSEISKKLAKQITLLL